MNCFRFCVRVCFEFISEVSFFVLGLVILYFLCSPLRCCLVVSTSATNCLERLVCKMTCCVEWDFKPYTLTHSAPPPVVHNKNLFSWLVNCRIKQRCHII